MPRVVLGLPVHNGEAFLSQCIDSILAQTYADFALVISDNASTDDTGRICRAYKALDRRVTYKRRETKVGAAFNFNGLSQVTDSEYFKWCAHDDVLAPTFLEHAVAALDSDPHAVLAHCTTTVIDAEGTTLEVFHPPYALVEASPSQRLQQVIAGGQRCYEVFGLIRRQALLQTRLIGNHRGGDNVLLYRLALLGSFRIVREPLFYLRRHDGQSTQLLGNSQAYERWFTGRPRGWFRFPDWRFLYESWRSSLGLPMSLSQRLACWTVLARYSYRCRRRLLQNMRVVVETLLYGHSDPMRRRLGKRPEHTTQTR